MPVLLTPEQLPARLNAQWSSSWLLHGDEILLQQEARDAIIAAAHARGFSERKTWVMEARGDWSALLQEAQTQGLFAERQLLDVRLPGGKPGKEGGQALQQLFGFAGDTLTVILSLPWGDSAMRHAAWFEALCEQAPRVRVDNIERDRLPLWIRARLQKLGLQLPAGEAGTQALAYLVDSFEGNLLGAQQELEKLALWQPGATLTLAMLEQNVGMVARYGLQRLSEALWSGKIGALHRILLALQAEGEAAVLVQWRINEDVRILHQAKQAVERGLSAAQALKQLRVWGPSATLLERIVGRVSLAGVRRWLVLCAQCDATVKGLSAVNFPKDPWYAVQTLATRIAWGLVPAATSVASGKAATRRA